ncbi:MAG TPA: putative manganese transporter, partial [Bacteroidales bacterium]|nr:putative manganese transporter [Bacteroidales bacterium]
MIESIFSIFKNSLSITFFVLTTMLFIEYINVRSSGAFSKLIKKNGFRQILLGSLLGVIPGCLGTYTIVTFYTHNLVSIGALTAAFVSTMGDEAFLLFSIQPMKALLIFAGLFVIGIVTGVIVDIIYAKKNKERDAKNIMHFEIHETEKHSISVPKFSTIVSNIKNASPHRALLLFGIAIILVLSLLGHIGHSHDFLTSFTIQPSVEHIHGESCEQGHEHAHEHGINWLAV